MKRATGSGTDDRTPAVSSPAFGLYGRNDADRKFGKLVRHPRKEQGFSQEKFAFRAGSHWTYIGDIERSENNATLVTADEGLYPEARLRGRSG